MYSPVFLLITYRFILTYMYARGALRSAPHRTLNIHLNALKPLFKMAHLIESYPNKSCE